MKRRNPYVAALVPVPPTGTMIGSSTVINETFNQITEKTFITGGTAGATVTMTMVFFGRSNPAAQYFYVSAYGGNMTAVGQQFNLILDGAGNANFTTIVFAGPPSPPGGITAQLQITAVTAGTIGPFVTKSYSHTN